MNTLKNVYQSVTKLVESLLGLYPEAQEIDVVFDPKLSATKNKFGHFNLNVSGIVVGKVGLSFKKLVEIFGGQLIVSVSETKTRKVQAFKPVQVLRITTTLAEFKQKDSEKLLSYYPASLVEANETFKKIHRTKQEYIQTRPEEPEMDLEYLE